MTRLLAATLLLALSSCQPAFAHSWYDIGCCSDRDCAPVKPGEVEPVQGGYRIRASGEFIPSSDRRIKPSADGDMHRCTYGGLPTANTICLYVPAGS